ncbi:MAG: formylglycine-generating enzyme family protein [Nostocales cyanobacterium 94392]|nr:formylglycine-generating enzyme family protein [Nostocales cyanobacterium 94392]
MANVFPDSKKPSNREDLTTRRIRVFAKRHGEQALFLAYHAAFPLTITSDLLYCLRENFVPDCPWYAVADVLLSGLCQPAGYDLYEMEGKTRNRLLRRLCIEFGEQRLKELANFMSQYIAKRLQVKDNDRTLVLGERPNWTALAYLSADGQEAVNAIKSELQRLTASADASERIKWAALVENYADLLSEKGFEPLLLKWAQNTLEAQPIQDDEETIIAKGMGIELQPFDYDVAVINSDDELEDELKSFEFETVTVDNRGQVINKLINKQQNQAFYFVEYLGEKAGEPAEIGIDMVAIPGGTFEMGSPDNEPKRRKSDSPQHTVSIQPFFMGKYPVTQAQWRKVAQLSQINRQIEPEPSEFKGDNRPVEQVSWYDALEFCDRLSNYTGRTYSLPTEAEWEYACRAGTTTPFYFGQTITGDLANYNASENFADEPKGEFRKETTPVGQFPPNTFGLYDMHGNVREWCLDDWHTNYEGAPEDGSAWLNDKNDNLSQKQGLAVLRGGSWRLKPGFCRSASRSNNNWTERDCIYNLNGFRVVSVFGRTP